MPGVALGGVEWDGKLPSSPDGAAAVTNNVVFTTTCNAMPAAAQAVSGK
jgi:hypothetical protein